MTSNPFVRLYETPAEMLTDGAYALLLCAALVATWWAAGRNALYLRGEWREGWVILVPFWYALRAVAMLVIAAVDLALLAAIITILT